MKKKFIAPAALAAAAAALIVPLTSSGQSSTICPAGITPPSQYCVTVNQADSQGRPAVTSDQKADAQKKADAAAPKDADGKPVPVEVVGTVGGAVLFVPTGDGAPSIADLTSGKITSLTVYVLTATADGTFTVTPTLYVHNSASRRAHAAGNMLSLKSAKKSVKAGDAVPVKVTLTKGQKATIKKAKVVKLVTKITATDAYGSKTTVQLQTLKGG